jgi:hypothetical protein
LSCLVDHRIKVCRSKALTLTGKQRRALLMKEDPRCAHMPIIICLLLYQSIKTYL